MNGISNIIKEMIEVRLSEAAALTNGEALKIGKLAKKEAENIRKKGGKLAAEDASYMDDFASVSFERNIRSITRKMNGGDTENREDVFKVVSAVIGKERAQALSRGDY